MYNYHELGFVNISAMLVKAFEGRYAIPAFNFISIEQINAIFDACIEKKSPLILLASPNLHKQLGYEMMARICQAGIDRIKNAGLNIPVALHLDHGMDYESCIHAVENGYSSIMIDGSALSFEENIRLTKKVVDYAHSRDITVEGELGTLSGIEEDDGKEKQHCYTDPAMAEEFVKRSGIDCLAISIGTSHGLVKIHPNPDGSLPELRFDILQDVQNRLPGFPIVLHGSSSIPSRYVDLINKYGGRLEQTIGIPEEQISRAARMAVCKVTI